MSYKKMIGGNERIGVVWLFVTESLVGKMVRENLWLACHSCQKFSW